MSELELDNLPPQNLEAERMVLGAVLVDNDALAVVARVLRVEDFYRSAHGSIYAAMLALREKREPIDLLTLSDAMRASGALEKVGGASYLSVLVGQTPTASNVHAHAGLVATASMLRQVDKICLRARGEVDAGADPDEIITAAVNDLVQVRRTDGLKSVSYAEVIRSAYDVVDRRSESGGVISGITTGLPIVDLQTDGMQAGEYIILGARPSMGKTALAQYIAAAAADSFLDKAKAAGKDPGESDRVGVISTEMSRDQVGMRELARESDIPFNALRNGDIRGDAQWGHLGKVSGRISGRPMVLEFSVFDDRSLEKRIDDWVQRLRVKLIVLDYLQLLHKRGHRGSREEEVAWVSRVIARKKQEHNVAFLILCQLNRQVEQRGGARRPMLSDLRESGQLEQDADVIWFLHREEYYNPCTCPEVCSCHRRNTADLIQAKGRNSGTWEQKLEFIRPVMQFREITGREG